MTFKKAPDTKLDLETINWDYAQGHLQELLAKCISEDSKMGLEAEEFTTHLYVYATIMATIRDKIEKEHYN